jgi:hypothetical protein
MNTGAFDRLLYTDCLAGHGRGAGGGFQVQAQSAAVDAAQSKMAVGWLLYDASNAWIAQGRQVPDFPLGFAHACEAGYGTAQSRYLGTEASGGRQGNHLADCLLTRDAGLYGPIRPAQLWRSPLWRAVAWPGTECPEFAGELSLGPLTVDAVAAWLQAAPQRPEILARLVSVLERPAPRVVIVANEPDEALRWIAAATLLLPINAALGTSFKVFCANHLRVNHRIVAVPKDLNAQLVPGRGESAFVVDAEAAISDGADVSDRARFWVGLLSTAEDPYDVIDAVELTASLDPGNGLGGPDAMLTAWAVTVPASPLTDPAALFRWLSTANEKLQAEHGGSVARRILAAETAAHVLRWLDDAACTGRIDIDGLTVRKMLFAAEIAEVRAGGMPPPESLPPTATDGSASRDAESEISSALLLANDQQVDRLLRLAMRHQIVPQLPPLLGRLGSFISRWLDNPGRDYHPAEWVRRQELLDMAHEQIQRRLAEGGPRQVMGVLKRLWPNLADRYKDPADPLDCQLAMAALRAADGEKRPSQLATVIRQAGQGHDPVAAMAGIQRGLIDWSLLGPMESRLLLAALPPSVAVAPEVVRRLVHELERTRDRPTSQMLDVLRRLDGRGIAPQGDPFPALLAADRDVLYFVEATRSDQFQADVKDARRWVAYLGQIEPTVIKARLRSLLAASLDYPVAGLGAGIIGVLPGSLPSLFIDLWIDALSGPSVFRATAWGYYWAYDTKLPGKLRSRISDAIKNLGTALSPEDLERWRTSVSEHIDSESTDSWARFVEHEVARAHAGRRGRGKEDGQ